MRVLEEVAGKRNGHAADRDLPSRRCRARQLNRIPLQENRAAAKPTEPVSASKTPGNFAMLADMPPAPNNEARPANAMTSAVTRSSVKRSPSSGQASSAVHTGIV